MNIRNFIREYPGKNRCDLSLLFRDRAAFAALIQRLAEPFRDRKLDAVAAIDSLGFVLGSALARELDCGLVLLRKAEKAAWSAQDIAFEDYSGLEKRLALVDGLVVPGDRVLVADDWSETGAQLEAAFALLEHAGADVIGAAVIRAEPAARQRLAHRSLHRVLVD